MKKIHWEKIIISYLIIVIITVLLFIPIDIIIYGDLITKNFFWYLKVNFSLNFISVFVYAIAVLYFNSKFWRGKMIFRIILELLFGMIAINIIQFIFQNLFGATYNLKDFILQIKDKYAFTSCIEGIFIILMIEMLYLYNKQKESELAIERFKFIQLKNQLNPHFLFNSLSISISLIKRNQDKAVDYMKKLSLVYRYVLINTESDFVSLKEEIDFIKKYIDILQIRYEEGLNVIYNIDDKLLNMSIVPMSLQLLVENAVKHNSIYSENPLNIHIYTEGKQIMVANNIIKKNAVIDSTEVGLKNLNQKYDILCSKDIEIINDSKNFIVKIPLV